MVAEESSKNNSTEGTDRSYFKYWTSGGIDNFDSSFGNIPFFDVITMLKSVVDSAPILFVKLGQEEVGAIDFSLTVRNYAENQVPLNYYNIDPFLGRFALNTTAGEPQQPVVEQKATDLSLLTEGDEVTHCEKRPDSDFVKEVCPDHIILKNSNTYWMRTDYNY